MSKKDGELNEFIEVGCTSVDYERGLEAPFYHCGCPRGSVFSLKSNKIRDTHTAIYCTGKL